MSLSQIERFEDLVAWQKARQLTSAIYAVTQSGAMARDMGLARQIQRAAVSIMSNIAEGYERANPGDFFRFLCIAKGSCAEVRSQLYVALDAGYITQTQFDVLFRQAEEVGRVVGGLRASVERRRKKVNSSTTHSYSDSE